MEGAASPSPKNEENDWMGKLLDDALTKYSYDTDDPDVVSKHGIVSDCVVMMVVETF
jgi:hypothetical protein